MDDRRKNYRAWDAQQNSHDSISPRDALPEGDLVFFLLDLIPQIDLTHREGLARVRPRNKLFRVGQEQSFLPCCPASGSPTINSALI